MKKIILLLCLLFSLNGFSYCYSSGEDYSKKLVLSKHSKNLTDLIFGYVDYSGDFHKQVQFSKLVCRKSIDGSPLILCESTRYNASFEKIVNQSLMEVGGHLRVRAVEKYIVQIFDKLTGKEVYSEDYGSCGY